MNKELELNKLNNFVSELRKLYTDNRQKLEGVEEKDLNDNDNFKICMKIAAVLSTINTTRASFDAFFTLVKEQCDYDITKFLDLYDVKFKEENGIKTPTIVPKDEQIQ